MQRKAEWDTLLGRRLYDEGLTYKDIAERCQTTPCAVAGFAHRYWPTRAGDERFANRYAKIKRFSSKRAEALAPPKAKPLAPGAPTLPPLQSLSFGD